MVILSSHALIWSIIYLLWRAQQDHKKQSGFGQRPEPITSWIYSRIDNHLTAIYFSGNSSRKSVSVLFKKFPAFLWNPTTRQQICRRLNLILSKFSPDHHLFHWSSLPLQNCVHVLFSHAYYMSFLSCSSPLLNHTIKVIQHSKNMD